MTLFTNIIKVLFQDKYKSLVEDLKKARNTESHRGDKSLSDSDFNQVWNDTEKMLVSHGFESKLVDEVKECDLFSHQKFRDIFLLIFSGKKSLFLFRLTYFLELDPFFVLVPQFPLLRYSIASAENKYVAFDKICVWKLNYLLLMYHIKWKLYHYSGKKDIFWLAWCQRIIVKARTFIKNMISLKYDYSTHEYIRLLLPLWYCQQNEVP